MRITIQEASELLQIPPQGIRELMKREIIDIGIVRPPSRKGGRHTYYIFKEKVEEILKTKSPQGQLCANRENEELVLFFNSNRPERKNQ